MRGWARNVGYCRFNVEMQVEVKLKQAPAPQSQPLRERLPMRAQLVNSNQHVLWANTLNLTDKIKQSTPAMRVSHL